ncbi:MAG: hypothetical protein COB98_04130 [Flavobacteriaceae bacterium]|nr:MAG: hypothetical protein COB98_04130 [Flavobacteriaceae bacterium]
MMLSVIIAVIGGMIACISFLYRKNEYIKKRFMESVIFQGIVGLLLIIVGLNGLITSFITIQDVAFYWVLYLVLSVVQIMVSFLLMYGLFSICFLEKNKNDKEIGQQIRNVLGKYQCFFGLVLCVVGLLIVCCKGN